MKENIFSYAIVGAVMKLAMHRKVGNNNRMSKLNVLRVLQSAYLCLRTHSNIRAFIFVAKLVLTG
jgi:hypothetical protein